MSILATHTCTACIGVNPPTGMQLVSEKICDTERHIITHIKTKHSDQQGEISRTARGPKHARPRNFGTIARGACGEGGDSVLH